MAGLPPDSRYVTGTVPPEMRAGIEDADGVVAQPTSREEIDIDGATAQITQIKVPRPAHIPAGPPRLPAGFETLPIINSPNLSIGNLQYDFPLLPDVQCRIIFQGKVTADHLEQVLDYIGVACKRLREQEQRDAAKLPLPTLSEQSETQPNARRRTVSTKRRIPDV